MFIHGWLGKPAGLKWHHGNRKERCFTERVSFCSRDEIGAFSQTAAGAPGRPPNTPAKPIKSQEIKAASWERPVRVWHTEHAVCRVLFLIYPSAVKVLQRPQKTGLLAKFGARYLLSVIRYVKAPKLPKMPVIHGLLSCLKAPGDLFYPLLSGA